MRHHQQPAHHIISIHALREESDTNGTSATQTTDISIHALREESDYAAELDGALHSRFQSTLSVRRATGLAPVVQRLQLISIHALREESDTAYRSDLRDEIVISIHALREESDRRLGRSP